mmetsp:Transcript_11333/g.14201  ORF Transcript_11333/g.14201 Transcript_11333/m.14201 type:complete len:738 (+) Transcript_11333:81-2294(+)
MGNYISSNSKSGSSLENLRLQVKDVGDQYPFGDDEILRISRCFFYLRHMHSHVNVNMNMNMTDNMNESLESDPSFSFLSNWGLYGLALPPPHFSSKSASQSSTSTSQSTEAFGNLFQVDQNLILTDSIVTKLKSDTFQQRKYLLQIVQKHILPTNFGAKLEQTIFAFTETDVVHNTGNENAVHNNHTGHANVADPNRHQNEHQLNKQRLEKFLQGLAEASRRGSRTALAVIYKCCIAMNMSNSDHDHNNNNNNNAMASAKDLLDLSYRLALASLILSQQHSHANNGTVNNHNRESSQHSNDQIEKNTAHDSSSLNGNSDHDNNADDQNTTTTSTTDCYPDVSSLYPQPIDTSLVQSLVDYHSNNQYNNNRTSSSNPYSTTSSSYYSTNTFNQTHQSQPNQETPNVTANNKSNSNNEDVVSLEAFINWTELHAPCLSSTIETFIHYIFFADPDKPYPPQLTEFKFPTLQLQHSAFFKCPSSSLLFKFALMSPSLSGNWRRLYTSDCDGLSFNRLQNSLLGYSGPTLIIIQEARAGGIFGSFTSTAWKEAKDFYGNSDCFLYQLYPTFRVIRPKGGATKNFMYCNSESRSRGYDGQAHGIGFGGTTEKPRFFICESFDGCMASASDLTFEAGVLLPPLSTSTSTDQYQQTSKYFDIESLEVWGVGGDELVAAALGARHEQRELVAANIRKARKVDKAAFLDDFQSGLIESKAFKHRGEMRGRDDCHIDDRKKNTYVYEK